MTLSKREKRTGAVTVLVFVILAADRLLLTPYLDKRDSLLSEEQNLLVEYRKARGTLSQWKELCPAYEGTSDKNVTEEETPENAALSFISDRAKESGLVLSLLKPAGAAKSKVKDKKGLPEERIFQVVGTGTMKNVSSFLWRLAEASFPVLTVEDMQLASRKEGTDDLTLQLRVCELCRPSACPQGLQVKNAETLPYDRYKVIAERNLFLKDRLSGTVSRSQTVRTILREGSVPAHRALLTGIVRRGSDYVAFFEDTVSLKITRVTQGDAFLRGRVDNITLDYVDYTEDGRKNSIKIGQYVEIDSPAESGIAKTPVVSGPAAVEVVQSPSSVKPGESALLEQLRRRRQQELK